MNSDSLKFIVLGDFGGKKDSPYVTRKQLIVAEAMNTIAGKHSAQFYISCGDNFYPRGVANVSDPRFQVQYDLLLREVDYNTYVGIFCSKLTKQFMTNTATRSHGI